MPLKVLNRPPTRPRRAARPERRRQRPEHAIQEAVLRYLTLERRVAWAYRFNTGAQVIAEPGAKRRFIRYAFPGCADILGQLRDGRLLAIEVKAPGRYPTAEQTAFLARVRRAGGCACLARSVADARAALDAHFAAPAPALALPERGRGRHLVWT